MQKGFTLIEVLLSIALLGLLVAFSLPVYHSFQQKNDFDVAKNTTIRTFRRANLLARSGERDSAWGIKIESGSITLFQGNSYASRDESFDEMVTFSPNFTVSGVTEVVFAKLSGFPSNTGTTTLRNTTGEEANISINTKGVINH